MPEICVACEADYPASLLNISQLLHITKENLGEITDKCSAALHIFQDDGLDFGKLMESSKVNLG